MLLTLRNTKSVLWVLRLKSLTLIGYFWSHYKLPWNLSSIRHGAAPSPHLSRSTVFPLLDVDQQTFWFSGSEFKRFMCRVPGEDTRLNRGQGRGWTAWFNLFRAKTILFLEWIVSQEKYKKLLKGGKVRTKSENMINCLCWPWYHTIIQ